MERNGGAQVTRAIVCALLCTQLCALLVLASACATTGTETQLPKPDDYPSLSARAHRDRPHRPPRTLDPAKLEVAPLSFPDHAQYAFLDGDTGRQISFDEVLARARAAQFVVVGEQHDQSAHHELERLVVASLAADGPGLAVGLEMLTWDHQPPLDRFNAGEIDTVVLEKVVDWPRAWGFPFAMYEPILVDGHKHGARFVALNAPRDLVRGVRKRGLDSLTDAELRVLPEIDLSDQLHRAWFEAIFKDGHPITQRDLDGFYAAQVVWDESMAEHAVRALDAGARQVVVLCGVGHVARGRGVPQRIERRAAQARVFTIVPINAANADDAIDQVLRAVVAGEGDVIVIPRFDEALEI
jgi:uncharacterized iron-regulated protein